MLPGPVCYKSNDDASLDIPSEAYSPGLWKCRRSVSYSAERTAVSMYRHEMMPHNESASPMEIPSAAMGMEHA